MATVCPATLDAMRAMQSEHVDPMLCWGLQMRAGIPALQTLIRSTDDEVLQDTCWALSYVADGSEDNIQV